MPTITGTSINGRQIVTLLQPTERNIYLKLTTPGLIVPSTVGVASVELSDFPYSYQLDSRRIATGGVGFVFPQDFLSQAEFAVYWYSPGLDWECTFF